MSQTTKPTSVEPIIAEPKPVVIEVVQPDPIVVCDVSAALDRIGGGDAVGHAADVKESLFRRIFETAEEGIWVIDATSNTSFINPKMASMLGYTLEEMRGKPLEDFMDEQAKIVARRHLLRRRAGEREQHDFRFRRKDGSFIWTLVNSNPLLDASGKFIGALAMISDITARKQTEQALLESESRMKVLIDATPDAIFFKDGGGRWLLINQSARTIFGLESVEYHGRTDAELADMIPPLRETLLYCSQTDEIAWSKGATVRGDEKIVEPGKPTRYLDVIKVPLFNADGTRHGLVVVARDVTERKEAEFEQVHLQAMLMQSQKMESVGRLAGGVAHDFNNMLAVILGYTDLAMAKIDPGQVFYDDLRHIREAAQHSADLTRQLLTYARKQSINARTLSLNTTITNMLAMLRRLIGDHVRIEWKGGAKPDVVKADPIQIDQVLANLSINARDAMNSGGGTLTIATSNVTIGDHLLSGHPPLPAGSYVVLSVRDTGRGMDKETLSHVFEPFFTTKEAGYGTGLGCAMVYGIVRQNGGWIDVDSEPGKGTTFRIYLPCVVDVVQPDAPVDASNAANGSETILLVEDDAAVRALVRAVLVQYGYKVLVAGGGQEAITIADRCRETIDMLLTDVMMPGMNGVELKRIISERFPRVVPLLMSGYVGDELAHDEIANAKCAFIQKPFTPVQLAAKVRETLDARITAAS
jgi:two-component system, cell cycle sensor histidine kinase and response regulator CckA